MKINCADYINFDEYPICNYVTEWNESEKFNELMLTELTLRADEINENPELVSQIYQEAREKVNNENVGLLEWCVNLRDWVYEQIRL